MARGRHRRRFLFGPLSTVAFETKSESTSCEGFLMRALAIALSITLKRTGAPAFVTNCRICSASAASLPRTRLAIILALRGEMRAYIALALLIIGEPRNRMQAGSDPAAGWADRSS
jgi:hypothetical protein